MPELPWAKPERWQNGLLVAAGLLAIVLTYRTYRFFESPAQNVSQHLSSGEADRLIASARQHLESYPEDFNAYAQMAVAFYNKGPDSYPDGLNALEKARTLGSTSDALFYYAGVMYDQLGLADYAVNELLKYNRHHPGHYETLVRLGNLYTRLNQFESAERYYKQVMGDRPRDPTVWFNYAVVCKERGRYDEALEALAKVRRLTQDRLPAGGDFQEGEIYRLKGAPDLAVKSYQRELSHNPDFLPALQALDNAARAASDWKESRRLRLRIQEVKAARLPPVVSPAPVVPSASPAAPAASAPLAPATPAPASAVPGSPATSTPAATTSSTSL